MAGVFGKMPAAGDFVARGLPRGAASVLDKWLTRHLAAADPSRWPRDGIRLVLDTPAGPLLAVAVPSEDRVGRFFPLAVAVPLGRAGAAEAERWAVAASALLAESGADHAAPDALARRLVALEPPAEGDPPLHPPLAWAVGEAPDEPEGVLRRYFGPSTSSG